MIRDDKTAEGERYLLKWLEYAFHALAHASSDCTDHPLSQATAPEGPRQSATDEVFPSAPAVECALRSYVMLLRESAGIGYSGRRRDRDDSTPLRE